MQRGALLALHVALPLSLLAGSVTGCGLLGGSSSLEDALETMPSTITRVMFHDRAAAADRLDLLDLGADPDADEVDAYVERAQDLPVRTDLDVHLVAMLDGAPFSALDLEWEATGYDSSGDYGRVWRMDDDLDLDDVADDLVGAGYTREDDGSAVTLSVDPSELDPAEQGHLVPIARVTLVPGAHLVVTGPLTAEVVRAVDDDTESLVDSGSFEELVDSTDDVEVADLVRREAVCSFRDARMTPDRMTAGGLDDLTRPERSAFFVHGEDGAARAVLLFDDEDAAEQAVEEREELLAEGSSPVSRVPYAEFGSYEVERDGAQVRIDVEYDEPGDVAAVLARRDYPSICAPGAD